MKYYTCRSFQIAVSDGAHIDQIRFDYAFMNEAKFTEKYGTYDIDRLLAEKSDGKSSQ
jgi:hypothetical protein